LLPLFTLLLFSLIAMLFCFHAPPPVIIDAATRIRHDADTLALPLRCGHCSLIFCHVYAHCCRHAFFIIFIFIDAAFRFAMLLRCLFFIRQLSLRCHTPATLSLFLMICHVICHFHYAILITLPPLYWLYAIFRHAFIISMIAATATRRAISPLFIDD